MDLCVGCGLCCDGSIHPFTLLFQGEKDPQTRRPVERPSVRSPQPCSNLAGGKCSDYEGRPVGCRIYFCKVARDLKARKLSEQDARDRIAAFKRARESQGLLTPAQVRELI